MQNEAKVIRHVIKANTDLELNADQVVMWATVSLASYRSHSHRFGFYSVNHGPLMSMPVGRSTDTQQTATYHSAVFVKVILSAGDGQKIRHLRIEPENTFTVNVDIFAGLRISEEVSMQQESVESYLDDALTALSANTAAITLLDQHLSGLIVTIGLMETAINALKSTVVDDVPTRQNVNPS